MVDYDPGDERRGPWKAFADCRHVCPVLKEQLDFKAQFDQENFIQLRLSTTSRIRTILIVSRDEAAFLPIISVFIYLVASHSMAP